MPWPDAWQSALYGPSGFFRTNRPADHFSTSAHLARFADAVAVLVQRTGSKTVADLGAGGGELLLALLARLGPEVRLIGVELAARPADLPPVIDWLDELPAHIEGLLIANEWLDNIPCEVVELDEGGVVRRVLVDPATGEETLGEAYESGWLGQWWPLVKPGDRAEIGTTRDAAWADAVARLDGMAIAIDYGHTRAARPPFGSLRSYVAGREVDVVPDGSRDVTAHVAVDSVAAAGATLIRQRDALHILGLDAARPPINLAQSDPAGYLRALDRAGEASELSAVGGLGDFWWIVSDTDGRGTLDA